MRNGARNDVDSISMDPKDALQSIYQSSNDSSSSSSSSSSCSRQAHQPKIQHLSEEETTPVEEEYDDNVKSNERDTKRVINSTPNCKQARANSNLIDDMVIIKEEDDASSTGTTASSNKMSPPCSSFALNNSSSSSSSSSSTGSIDFSLRYAADSTTKTEEKGIKHSIHSILGLNRTRGDKESKKEAAEGDEFGVKRKWSPEKPVELNKRFRKLLD